MRFEIGDPDDYSAGLYVRLSREDEREGCSGSVSNQIAMLESFAAEHGLSVKDVYIDDGWSGTSFERPAFRRMIADIEAKSINMVVTKDLSRLGRDYIMTGHYLERYFPEHAVRYISLLDGVDTGVESTANDITPFKAIMNDMYAKDISKKIASVKQDKRNRGLFTGGKAVYGYRLHPAEPNRLVVDQEAARVVVRIFKMALEGLSCREIASRLNDAGVRSPARYAGLPAAASRRCSGLWSGERISDMLQNETYIGNLVQGRRLKLSYKAKRCVIQPRESWVVVKNTHEPLIDAETFSRVQQLLESRRHTRSRTYDFPLKGLIFCHECGRPLGVLNRKNANGDDVLYFVCRTYQRNTRSGECTSHTVKERIVADAVAECAREECGGYVHDGALLSAVYEELDALRAPGGGTADRSHAARRRLERLNDAIDAAYMDKLSGLLSERDFVRVYARLDDQRAQLERDAATASMEAFCPVVDVSPAPELVERFFAEAFHTRELLTRLIERVELCADRRVIVCFRFKNGLQ